MNPVLASARLNQKRTQLESIERELKDFLTQKNDFVRAVEKIGSEEELDSLERSVDDIEKTIEEKETKKNEISEEIEKLEQQLNETNRKTPSTGASERRNRNMHVDAEYRDGIIDYIRSKGETRQFTSVEGGALIPEELLTPKKELTDTLDLSQYVNKAKVNRGSGKYPVIKKAEGRMVSVAELAKNPELANPTFFQVAYDIETFRGYIPVSQESIDDADYDVISLIAESIDDQELNTKNYEIASILKTATAKTVSDLDELITMLNVDFKEVYDVKCFISKSLFNEVDLLKDKNGRYLLEVDITVRSKRSIKGHEVVIIDDDVIGVNKGDLVGFIGDAKEYCTLFDRKRASVKWVDNDVYGQLLAAFVRFDFKKVDDEAGYYITYTPTV